MAKTFVLGNEIALLTHLIDVHASVGAGLRAQEVNGADRQSFDSARRILLPSVRSALLSMPGTTGTIVFLFFCSLLAAALFNRTLDVSTRLRFAFQALHFFRYWRAWVMSAADYNLSSNYMSQQLHVDTVIAVHTLALLVILWQRDFPDRAFCPWLLGSDQLERLFSELRAFVKGNSNWTFLQFMAVCRRWTHQTDMQARVNVTLAPITSAHGYNKHLYLVHPAAPLPPQHLLACDDIAQLFRSAITPVQRVLSLLGMEKDLKASGKWAQPPLENFEELEQSLADSGGVDGSCDPADDGAEAEQRSDPGAGASGEGSEVLDSDSEEAADETDVEDASSDGSNQAAHDSDGLDSDSEVHHSISEQSSDQKSTDDAPDSASAQQNRADSVGSRNVHPVQFDDTRDPFPFTGSLSANMSLSEMLEIMCGAKPSLPAHLESGDRLSRRDYVLIAGEWVHKSQALIQMQADQLKKLKQGRDRVKQHGLVGVRAEDDNGDGFKSGAAYQYQVVSETKSNTLMHTNVVYLLELRKPFNKRLYPRMSVAKKDQASVVGVVIDLVRLSDSRFKKDAAQSRYRTVPLSELGCRVHLLPGLDGSVDVTKFDTDCGGMHIPYTTLDVPESAFGSNKMLGKHGCKLDESSMRVADIVEELKCRKQPSSGLPKHGLFLRLRTHMIRCYVGTPAALPAPAEDVEVKLRARPDPFNGAAYAGDLDIVRSGQLSRWTNDQLKTVLKFHSKQRRFRALRLAYSGLKKEALIANVRALLEAEDVTVHEPSDRPHSASGGSASSIAAVSQPASESKRQPARRRRSTAIDEDDLNQSEELSLSLPDEDGDTEMAIFGSALELVDVKQRARPAPMESPNFGKNFSDFHVGDKVVLWHRTPRGLYWKAHISASNLGSETFSVTIYDNSETIPDVPARLLYTGWRATGPLSGLPVQ
jgi:hypothetical protein